MTKSSGVAAEQRLVEVLKSEVKEANHSNQLEATVLPISSAVQSGTLSVPFALSAALQTTSELVWRGKEIEDFVYRQLVRKLEFTPPENISAPDIAIAGPVLEALRYTRHRHLICELYLNLLASALDIKSAKTVHPGYVDIIKNMTSDEVRIIAHLLEVKVIPVIDINKVRSGNLGDIKINTLVSTIGVDAGCEYEELSESYLNNLERIGLIEIPKDTYITDPGVYDRILTSLPVKAKIHILNRGKDQFRAGINKYFAKLTLFGRYFGQTCVIGHS
ncbi:MAG: DUF4393 domain-containing protein [bacterium]